MSWLTVDRKLPHISSYTWTWGYAKLSSGIKCVSNIWMRRTRRMVDYRCVDKCAAGGGRYLYSGHCSEVCHSVCALCCRMSCAWCEDRETICNVSDGHATTYLGARARGAGPENIHRGSFPTTKRCRLCLCRNTSWWVETTHTRHGGISDQERRWQVSCDPRRLTLANWSHMDRMYLEQHHTASPPCRGSSLSNHVK